MCVCVYVELFALEVTNVINHGSFKMPEANYNNNTRCRACATCAIRVLSTTDTTHILENSSAAIFVADYIQSSAHKMFATPEGLMF